MLKTNGAVFWEAGDGDDFDWSDTANYQSPSYENHEGRFAVYAPQLLGVRVVVADLRDLHCLFGVDLERNFLPHRHDDFGHAKDFL